MSEPSTHRHAPHTDPTMIRRQSAKVHPDPPSPLPFPSSPSDKLSQGEWIPGTGQWPVGPQDEVQVDKSRIWVDGCFDFSHHGTMAQHRSPLRPRLMC